MNPEWIAKAQHALETRQPELAKLYMRRGLSETPDGRRWLAQQRQVEALADIARAHRDFAAALVDVFAQFARTYTTALQTMQDDYALAGPTEGTAS